MEINEGYELVNRMLHRASAAHAHQKRVTSEEPYLVHVVGVLLITQRDFPNNYPLHAVALGHDIKEDVLPELRDIINVDDFPQDVQDAIELLSKYGHMSKSDAVRKITDSPDTPAKFYAMVVKMADRLYNTTDKSKFGKKYAVKDSTIESTGLLLEHAEESGMTHLRVYQDLKAVYEKSLKLKASS
jgi:(p)ppGpp synthase/HD superfamily hydrolase